jgi:hypothetical protein
VGAGLIVGLRAPREPSVAARRPHARTWPTVESWDRRPAADPDRRGRLGVPRTGHLFVYELVLDWAPAPSGIPFFGVTGLTVAAYLAGLLAVGVLMRSWALRRALSALGLLVMVAACAAELSGPPVVAAEIALVVLGSAACHPTGAAWQRCQPGSDRTGPAGSPRARLLLVSCSRRCPGHRPPPRLRAGYD